MRNILFHCSTPFQIMMSIHLRTTLKKNDKVDIIVSNHIKDGDMIVKGLLPLGIFGNVFYFDGLKYDSLPKGNLQKIELISHVFLRRYDMNHLLNKEHKNKKVYNELWIQEILTSTNVLYDYLRKINRNLKVCFYEESPLTVLCDGHDTFISRIEAKEKMSKLERILYAFTFQSTYGRFEKGYSSIAKRIRKKYYFPFYEIPNLRENQKLLGLCNAVWDPTDEYSGKVVYFEESFYIDAIEFDDMKIVNDIVAIVGKVNLIVKLHPRTKHDRFRPLGIRTNRHTNIPWELIVWNHLHNSPILISVASGSLIYPQIYLGIEQKAIALIKCSDYKKPILKSKYYKTYLEFCENEGIVSLPNTRDEFRNLLYELVKERK